jgi:hypothetical protein
MADTVICFATTSALCVRADQYDILFGMAKNDQHELRAIVERAAEWPEQAREELVESMLSIEARYYGAYITTKEDRVALKQSADDVHEGRFASDEDTKKVFHRFNRA